MKVNENNIEFRATSLMQYYGALSRLAYRKETIDEFGLEEESTHIFKSIDQNMSAYLSGELDYMCKKVLLHMLVHHFAMIRQVETVETFISDLKNLGPQEAKFTFIDALIDLKADEISDKAIARELEECEFLSETGVEAEDLIEFFEQFELMFGRIIMFFEQFYEKVFRPIEDEIMTFAQKRSDYYEGLFDQDREGFISMFVRVNTEAYLLGEYRCIMFINVTNPVHMEYTMEKDKPELLYCALGEAVIKHLKSANSEKLIKFLGETTKMSIIKLLMKEATYASAMAKALNLNRATVSHHMNQLTQVKAVEIAYVKGNRAYYKINHKSIKEGLDDFMTFISEGKDNE